MFYWRNERKNRSLIYESNTLEFCSYFSIIDASLLSRFLSFSFDVLGYVFLSGKTGFLQKL